jgi:hypothetical protein
MNCLTNAVDRAPSRQQPKPVFGCISIPVLVIIFSSAWMESSQGQLPIPADGPKMQTTKSSIEMDDNSRALVDILANHNPRPKLVGEGPVPLFDVQYNWEEDRRVQKAIPVLARHAEDAWGELVQHLNDERYCATFESVSGELRQLTVGDMCREIIGRSLSQAYYKKLKPEQMVIYARFRIPEFAREKKELKAWCEARSKKILYELQIEVCEWMITELAKPDDIRNVPRSLREAWIASIKDQVDSLRKAEKPVPFPGFGSEEYTWYTRDEAEAIRAAHSVK